MVGQPLPVRAAHLDAGAEPGLGAKLANFVLFELAWFAAVLGAAQGHALLGSLAIAAVLAWHLAWSRSAWREALLLAAVTLMGLVAESLQLRLGLIAYAGSDSANPWPPVWLLLLWTLFASTLNLSMRWLRGRYLLAAVLAAVFGPAAFAAGVRMGAAQYLQTQAAVAVQALCWALLLPLMLALAQRLDGAHRHREGSARA